MDAVDGALLVGLYLYVGSTMAWAGSRSPRAVAQQRRTAGAWGTARSVTLWAIAAMIYVVLWPLLIPQLIRDLRSP